MTNASINLRNKVCSYLFEQECGELSKASPQEIELLKKVPAILANIAKKNGTKIICTRIG